MLYVILANHHNYSYSLLSIHIATLNLTYDTCIKVLRLFFQDKSQDLYTSVIGLII